MEDLSASMCQDKSSCSVATLPSVQSEAGAVLNSRRVKARDVELRIDPEFWDILPEPCAASLAALRANLIAHGGCTNFILVWAGTDTIIDGHNRYPLCREDDLWIWLGEIELADREAVKEWIRKLQLSRRDLSQVAASCVRGEAYNARKGAWGGDHKSAKSNGHDVRLIAAAQQVGEEFGVTERTIRRDGWLAESMTRIVANCGAKARRALLSPDHKVTRSAIMRLAKQDAEGQEEAIQYLVRNGRLPHTARKDRTKVLLPRKRADLVPALIRLMGIREAEKFHKMFGIGLEEAKARPSATVNRSGSGC